MHQNQKTKCRALSLRSVGLWRFFWLRGAWRGRPQLNRFTLTARPGPMGSTRMNAQARRYARSD